MARKYQRSVKLLKLLIAAHTAVGVEDFHIP